MVRTLTLLCLLASCDGGAGTAPDGGTSPDAEPLSQGGEAVSELVLNELSPTDDWVELYNRGSSTLELSDYFLTDNPDRLDHFLRLSGAIDAGEYLVVELAEAPFGLGTADQATLLTDTGQYVDGVSYLFIGAATGQTLARQPDGEGPFYFAAATPGEAN